MNVTDYDLTLRMSKYMDRHMMLPLIDFVQSLNLYDEKDLLQARLDLLEQTHMVDFYNELYKERNGGNGNARERQPVIDLLEQKKCECAPVLNLIADKKRVAEMRERKELTPDHLKAELGIQGDHIEALFHFAKVTFDCGRYHDAAEYLFFYRILSRNEEHCFLALWGQLAADIVLTHWDDALEGIHQLSDAIDAMVSLDQYTQLQYRTWLMHWGLFIFFNHDNGRNAIVEFFAKEK